MAFHKKTEMAEVINITSLRLDFVSGCKESDHRRGFINFQLGIKLVEKRRQNCAHLWKVNLVSFPRKEPGYT